MTWDWFVSAELFQLKTWLSGNHWSAAEGRLCSNLFELIFFFSFLYTLLYIAQTITKEFLYKRVSLLENTWKHEASILKNSIIQSMSYLQWKISLRWTFLRDYEPNAFFFLVRGLHDIAIWSQNLFKRSNESLETVVRR